MSSNTNSDCTAAARLFAGGDSAINPVTCCQGQHLTAIDLACDPDGRITRLSLAASSLPADVSFRPDALSSSLPQLTKLQVLRLPNAGLSGGFPAAAVASLTELTFLDLSGNALSGTLPESLATTPNALRKLESLNLNGNALTGSLSPLRNAPLSTLSVAGSSFTGPLPSIASLTSCVGLAAGVCRPLEGASPCAASLPVCPQPTTATSSTSSSSPTTTTTTLSSPSPTSTVNLNATSPTPTELLPKSATSDTDPNASSSSSLSMWLGIAGGILGAVLLAFLLLLFIARRRRRRRRRCLTNEKLSSSRPLASASALERGSPPPPPLATYSKVSTKPNASDPEHDDHEQDLADASAALITPHPLRHVDSADHLLINSPNSPHAMVVEPPRVPGHGGGTDTHSLLTTNARSAAAGPGTWARTLRQGSFSEQQQSMPPPLRGKPSRMSLASGPALGSTPLSPPMRAHTGAHAHPTPGPIIDVTASDVYDMFFGLPRVPGCTTQQLHPRTVPLADPAPGAARQSHMWRTTMVSESSGSTGAEDAEEWAAVTHAWDATMDALHARITRFMTSPNSVGAAQMAGETAWSLLAADLDFSSTTGTVGAGAGAGAGGFMGTNPDLGPPPSPTLGATSTGRAARTAAVMHFASIELVKFLAGVQASAAVAACAHRVYGVAAANGGGGAGGIQGEVSAADVPRVFASMARMACGAVHARLVAAPGVEGVDDLVVGATADVEMEDEGVAREVGACVRQFVGEVRALAGEYEGNLALKLNVLGLAGSGVGTPTRPGSPFLDASPLSPSHSSSGASASALGLTDVFVLAAIHWARIKALRPGLGLVIVPPGTSLHPAWMDDSANQNASARPFVQVLGTCFPALVEAVPDVQGGQGWSWRVVKCARVWMREDGPRRGLE